MRLLLAAVLTLSLTACGFHLRQQVSLPSELSAIRVESTDAYSPLQRNLEQALRRSGATLVEGAGASAVLRVFEQRMDRLPLSVGDTGRVQEYLMRYRVDFELVDVAGKGVLPRQKIELERDYTFDTRQAFGTPGEEEVVKAELERDMVSTLMRRVDAATRAN